MRQCSFSCGHKLLHCVCMCLCVCVYQAHELLHCLAPPTHTHRDKHFGAAVNIAKLEAKFYCWSPRPPLSPLSRGKWGWVLMALCVQMVWKLVFMIWLRCSCSKNKTSLGEVCCLSVRYSWFAFQKVDGQIYGQFFGGKKKRGGDCP